MHLIYKVTNKLDGKIYIGQKSYVGEPSMADYYGGGTDIKRAVNQIQLLVKSGTIMVKNLAFYRRTTTRRLGKR